MSYYIRLALKGLRRNLALTVLIVTIIGIGDACFVASTTVFLAMSHDPVAHKAERLYALQLVEWVSDNGSRMQPNQLSFDQATLIQSLRKNHKAAAMYATSAIVAPTVHSSRATQSDVRGTSKDFFSMFDVPFRYGSAWSEQDDLDRANVVILSKSMNQKLFGDKDSTGQTVVLDGHTYTVHGVIDHWQPVPRFYDLHKSAGYGQVEDIFMPLSRAIEGQMAASEDTDCFGDLGQGWAAFLHSNCAWLQMWMEFRDKSDAAAFVSYLRSIKDPLGSTDVRWAPKAIDVKAWLNKSQVVTDDVQLMLLVSAAFLFLCLINSSGLMLAKALNRTDEISIRRALGANRMSIQLQHLIEYSVLGTVGGLVGLFFAATGLKMAKHLVASDFAQLTNVTLTSTLIAMTVSVVGAIIAGTYPMYWALYINPSLKLKLQ